MDTRQTIVFADEMTGRCGTENPMKPTAKTVSGNVWNYRRHESGCHISDGNTLCENGVEDGEEHTYTNLDFAAFTVEYDE
ncbi:MAG: hypothetical protein ACLS2X_00685 [Coprococcus sp.]